MPRRSRKLRALGTEANLLPAAGSPVRDLPPALDKSSAEKALESSLDKITGEDETGRPFSAFLSAAVERIRSFTGADGAVIALMDAWGLICRASTGAAPVIGSRLQSYSGLTRECLETGKVVICEDTEHDSRVDPSVAKGLQLRSAALAPIVVQGSVLGVIEIFSNRVSGFDAMQAADLLRMALLLGSLIPPQPQENRPGEQRLLELPRREPVAPVGSIWPALRVWALATLLLVVMLLGHRRHVAKPSPSYREPFADREPFGMGRDPSQNSVVSSRSSPGDTGKTPSGSAPQAEMVPDKSTTSDTPEIPPAGKPLAHEVSEEALPAAPARAAEVRAELEPPPPQILASAAPLEPPVFGVGPVIPAAMKLRDSSPSEFVLDRTLQGHSSWVTAVAFSADGQKLASGSWDQSVKFWDVRTGQQLSIVANKMKGVEALAFSRDGRWLAAENSNDAVTLWDGNTGREIRTFTSNKRLGVLGNNWVYSIAFSPDGRWLASAVDEKTIRLWDVKTGLAYATCPPLRGR